MVDGLGLEELMVLRDGLASSSSQLDAYFLLWDAGLLFFRPCSDEETDYSLYPDSRAFGHNGHYGCSQGYVFFCNDTFLKMTTEKDSKAKAAKKAALQGAHSHSTRRVQTSVTFHRPKLCNFLMNPGTHGQCKSVPLAPRMDQSRVTMACIQTPEQ